MAGHSRGVISGCCAALIALLAGGCGGSSDYAKESPAKILGDAVRTMAAASSYQAAGRIEQDGAPVQATLTVHIPARIDAAIDRGAELIRVISVPPNSYLYANRAFWHKNAAGLPSSLVTRFANRWFKAPTAMTTSLTGSFATLAPKQLSTCLSQAMVKPTVTGTQTVAGQTTVVLHTNGGAPGQAPGNLYVATSAPHYVLRFQQTGKPEAGGTGPCANGPTGSDSAAGVLTFSRWNSVTVRAPQAVAPLP